MSRPLLERRDCGAPLWASFLFSSGVHMAAISLILFFPSWSHKSYYTAPKAFMVSLVELPGLPKGTGSIPSVPASPAPRAAEKPKAPAPEPAKPAKAKEVKASEARTPVTQPRLRPALKESPPAQSRPAESVPTPAPRKAQRAAPAPPSTFTLPPLPSVAPGAGMTYPQGEGVPGAGGPASKAPAGSVSSAAKGAGSEGETGMGVKSGKEGAVLGVASALPGVSVDNPDFQFTYYLVIIQNKISNNWAPPHGGEKLGEKRRTVVAFRILRNGQVKDIRVETPSGASFLDQSAVRAISRSSPLPPLPQRFLDDFLGVHFSFELEGGRG